MAIHLPSFFWVFLFRCWVESKSVHKITPSPRAVTHETPMIGDDLLIFLFISSNRVLFPASLAGKKQKNLQYSCGGVFVASIFSRNKTLKNLNFDIASDSDLLWLLTWKGKAIKTSVYNNSAPTLPLHSPKLTFSPWKNAGYEKNLSFEEKRPIFRCLVA